MSGGPFISEIHYDNAGGDVGEFVEICAPAGTDISAFTLVLYNGANGNFYDSEAMPAAPCGTSGGKDFYVISISGIQNGAPDGMALVNNATSTVCEFISYEGSFTANDGPAAGTMSTDIGVSESGSTPVGESLQLGAMGWEGPQAETPCAPICFLEGTKVLTDKGYKNIEALKENDLVQGQDNKLHPVKWIGVQTIDPNAHVHPYSVLPIKIKANALGENVPSNDLFLSPNHALCIDDLLINAGALVNNVNIQNTYSLEPFKYYHIELESHELVITENTFTESYLPQNDKRSDFDNGKEIENGKVLLFPLSLPRISSIVKVPSSIKNNILSRAEEKIQKTA